MTRHIPVTILGGYLGAGKTTVINHLLAGDHGVRVAVLVNDFGAVNVDASLIAETADDSIALTNGCVCCSIADDLGEALDAQTARAEPPDHIVIEASGVAEPARIAAYAQGWPGVMLSNVVTVADAETVQTRARDKYVGGVVRRQIQAADLLVLNKVDRAREAQSVRQWLQGLSDAACIETTHGRVAASALLGGGAQPAAADLHDHHADHGLHNRVWRPLGRVDRQKLEKILTGASPVLHRIKGWITAAESGKRLLVQGVGAQLTMAPDSDPRDPDALVLIGPDADALDDLLENLNGLTDQS